MPNEIQILDKRAFKWLIGYNLRIKRNYFLGHYYKIAFLDLNFIFKMLILMLADCAFSNALLPDVCLKKSNF